MYFLIEKRILLLKLVKSSKNLGERISRRRHCKETIRIKDVDGVLVQTNDCFVG